MKIQYKFFILCCLLLLAVFHIQAAPVSLTSGTATHSQGGFSVDGAVDADGYTGWAISFRTSVNEAIAETAAWETTSNVNATLLTFTMVQNYTSRHILGRFRFSITSDDRSLFADGLDSGGDVIANWIPLAPSSVSLPSGLTSSIQADGSILVLGTNDTATYVVQYSGNFTNITGIRLEAIEDSRLGTGGALAGPGLQPINGNFVLQNLIMDAQGTPIPDPIPELSSLCFVGLALFYGLWNRYSFMTKKSISLLLVILVLSFAHADLITTGLVGYWGGENNANDISSLANHGTYYDGNANTGDNYTAGAYGQAFRFTSNSYVNVGVKSSLVMSSTMSVAFWLRPLNTGTEGMLINKEGEYEVCRYGDNSIRWAFANSTPGWAYVSTGIYVVENQWAHITITYNNGIVKTYLNGSTTPSHVYNGAGTIGDAHASEHEFRIGSRQSYAQPNFYGDMDEIALYNRVLTDQEVNLLYQGPVIPEPASLILLYFGVIFVFFKD